MSRSAWFLSCSIVFALLFGGLVGGVIAPQAFGSASAQLLQGDTDCNGAIAPRDGQGILNVFLGKAPLSQTEPCPDIGSVIQVGSTPTPVPSVGLERSNPAPAGQPYDVPEGWELTVLGFTPDATQEVLAENQFNDPPKPGMRFSIARVSLKNISAGNPGNPDPDFALRMVGSEGIGYSTFQDGCGVIPDSFTFKSHDVFEGASQEGNVCYQTKIGETGFTIYTNYFLSDHANVRWLGVP